MPRVDFQLWDRVYILKLMCTVQATYSSFLVLVYVYLITLQSWLSSEEGRSDIMKYKWIVIVVTILDFGLGILLAFAANTEGGRRRQRILTWIISETFLVPISIFPLMQLYKRLIISDEHKTDAHYSRVNIAQICFLLAQYLFIAYAVDFLVQGQKKVKTYDPSIRPKSVYEPTDPEITTTESRHIRISQSLLFQPLPSTPLPSNSEEEEHPATSNYDQVSDTPKEKGQEETQCKNWRINDSLTDDAGRFQNENKKEISTKRKIDKKKAWKDKCWMKEKAKWFVTEEKELARVRAKKRRCDEYWMKEEEDRR